jgi:hypothetical protein
MMRACQFRFVSLDRALYGDGNMIQDHVDRVDTYDDDEGGGDGDGDGNRIQHHVDHVNA